MSEIPVSVREEATIEADRIPDSLYVRPLTEPEQPKEALSIPEMPNPLESAQNDPERV